MTSVENAQTLKHSVIKTQVQVNKTFRANGKKKLVNKHESKYTSEIHG